ncbi:recombinase family protein [Pseudoduganella danionis]|uniref:Helix-turn-helix domain-containing protein n=1 Tax=Pseudoduganella danionis TaxID=1890295 RepID=A0ABW9SRS7_9BURK|nr:helix-turn-helix domain-containing protein [Pseudoduganella danionis]
MAAVGYVRVSSVDQNLARQLEGMKLDRVFEDKVSGKDTKRPALQEMLLYVREGDTLHVHSIDRLARNLVDLRKLVETLNSKGVIVTFHKEALTFSPDQSNPMSVLMLNMMGAFAEFERSMIRERQREGIAAAKAQGKTTGRPNALTTVQAAIIRERAFAGESKTKLASEYSVTRSTVYAVLNNCSERDI